MKFQSSILLLLISCGICASEALGREKRLRFNTGTDLYQPQYKEQKYKFDDYGVIKKPLKNISRVSIGASYKMMENSPLYIGFKTTRFINGLAKTEATDTDTDTKVDVHQKFITDSIYLAKYITRHVAPFIVATKLKSETYFIDSGGSTIQSEKSTTLLGFGLAYSFSNEHTVAFTYFLPDDEINTKRIFGVSYSYTFASIM